MITEDTLKKSDITVLILEELRSFLKPEQILTGEDLKIRYSHIWTMETAIDVRALVMPASTDEVSQICKVCDKHDQEMLVFGGLTNLVGATRTKETDLVISMERMNVIEDVNRETRTMTVQSGVVLEQIHEEASANDLLFPLSFGAKGSCQIGGCISTNAGGLRVMRFGMTRQQILGLEVVLTDGTIISSMKQIIKDNSGIDLKQLFIGAEGTLGIVTRAVLKLRETFVSQNCAFVGLESFEKVIQFLKFMEKGCAGQLSAFELLLSDSYNCLTSEDTVWNAPLPNDYPFYVLVDTLGGAIENDRTRMEALLEEAMLSEMIVDAAVAYTDADVNWFWNLREDVSILSKNHPYNQHFDISLPIHIMATYLEDVKKELLAFSFVEACYVFGHVADGNMHLVIGKTNESIADKETINEVVYKRIKEFNGSVSAEHGIGLDKRKYLPMSRSTEEIALMKLLKKTMDPKGLLNRGRIIEA